MKKIAIALLLIATLTACGKKVPVRPPDTLVNEPVLMVGEFI